MLTRKVKTIAGTLNVVIPRHICDLLGIQSGDYVEFRLEGNRIYFRRV